MDTRATFLRAPRILAELLKVICIVVLNLFIAVILAIGSGEAPIELWATPVIVVAGGEIILLQRPGWLPLGGSRMCLVLWLGHDTILLCGLGGELTH